MAVPRLETFRIQPSVRDSSEDPAFAEIEMLCKLAIKRTRDASGAEIFTLRVSGKTSLGPSGTGGRDDQEFANAGEPRRCLQSLRLSDELLMAADAILQDPGLGEKFATLTDEEQIPFEVLEQAGFALFDSAE